MNTITIHTKSGTVTATRPDEESLNWVAVYPWGTQTLYGEAGDVESFIGRRLNFAAVERGEAL